MSVLRKEGPGIFSFYCPGCKFRHVIYTEGSHSKLEWKWNGSMDKPTFTPSLLVHGPMGDPPVEMRCHSFIRDGALRFLSDCTHEWAGLNTLMFLDPPAERSADEVPDAKRNG